MGPQHPHLLGTRRRRLIPSQTITFTPVHVPTYNNVTRIKDIVTLPVLILFSLLITEPCQQVNLLVLYYFAQVFVNLF